MPPSVQDRISKSFSTVYHSQRRNLHPLGSPALHFEHCATLCRRVLQSVSTAQAFLLLTLSHSTLLSTSADLTAAFQRNCDIRCHLATSVESAVSVLAFDAAEGPWLDVVTIPMPEPLLGTFAGQHRLRRATSNKKYLENGPGCKSDHAANTRYASSRVQRQPADLDIQHSLARCSTARAKPNPRTSIAPLTLLPLRHRVQKSCSARSSILRESVPADTMHQIVHGDRRAASTETTARFPLLQVRTAIDIFAKTRDVAGCGSTQANDL